MAEQETTISKLVAFASDPDVKAIVMCQACLLYTSRCV